MQDNKRYKVNRDKCVGCGTCVAVCPRGMDMDSENKAKVISSAAVEECGGVELCSYEAIEEVNGAELADDEER